MHWRVVLATDAQGRCALLADRAEERPLKERVEALLRGPARWLRCESAEIDELLGEGSAEFRALAQFGDGFGPVADAAVTDELSPLRIAREPHPVVRLLDSTLYDALQDAVSDIHFETRVRGLAIRYRIDGVMVDVRQVDGTAVAEQLVSRLKVMAELDIGERRLPQDGRFKLRCAAREIDFRLSVMPSVFGEDAVVRVLDRAQIEQSHGQLSLEALGFDPDIREAVRALARLPHGMLLVTGPTGSGKTTTLYAAISEINDGRDKIVTIEDPVEYQLPGVVQIPVNDKKGLSFARGLRSILRHDPDRVMVGEIRDTETAQIAIQAALTGHLVFSTVHANTAFDVLGRFMHMGLDLYNVVSALNGVLAQRLMRVNCAHCRTSFMPPRERLDRYTLGPVHACARGMGCGHCRGTGYRGRRAVAELLLLDDELRDLIAARSPMGRIKAAARDRGLRRLRDAALDMVVRGETTFEELDRVTLAD
ncbi:MAG: type II/IV secretion system protein [Burkholderiales bacterium]|nr:type II/IV secretion system protein [Burkholderiales bacterium]